MSARHSVKGDIFPEMGWNKIMSEPTPGIWQSSTTVFLLTGLKQVGKKTTTSIHLSSWNSHLKYDCPVETKPTNRKKHGTPCRPVLTGALNLRIQPDRLRWLHREESHTSSSTRSPDPVDLRCLVLKNWTSTKIGHVSFGFLMDAILGFQILKRISDPLFWFFGHVWEKSQF